MIVKQSHLSVFTHINQECTPPPVEVLKVWDLKIEDCHEYCYH